MSAPKIDLESHVTTSEVTNNLLAMERTECLLLPQIQDISVNHDEAPNSPGEFGCLLLAFIASSQAL